MIIAIEHNTEHHDLVEQCKKGDDKAFRELYRLYAKPMFNASMRILNNRDEAEDVLQESFVAAFRHIRSFEEKGSFGSWLKRIVINRSLDALKKQKQNFIQVDELDIAEEEAEEENGFEYDAVTLQKAIDRLPDGYRVILTLFLFEDYSHRMIAEKLGISESTSKSQYLRARKKLGTYLKEQK
ncbi:MAG: polymerase [Bacteroidetes bacterium]|nr:polymerase [Bacteroidota bacterium]